STFDSIKLDFPRAGAYSNVSGSNLAHLYVSAACGGMYLTGNALSADVSAAVSGSEGAFDSTDFHVAGSSGDVRISPEIIYGDVARARSCRERQLHAIDGLIA